MTGFSATASVKRPASEVFAYLADIENEKHWREGVESVVCESGEPAAPGAKYLQKIAIMGQEMSVRIELTGVSDGQRLTYVFAGGPMKGDGTYDVVDEGDCCTVTGGLDLGNGVMAKTMSGMLRARFERDLEQLKAVLER